MEVFARFLATIAGPRLRKEPTLVKEISEESKRNGDGINLSLGLLPDGKNRLKVLNCLAMRDGTFVPLIFRQQDFSSLQATRMLH
jgi:hypothetical protein